MSVLIVVSLHLCVCTVSLVVSNQISILKISYDMAETYHYWLILQIVVYNHAKVLGTFTVCPVYLFGLII